MDNYHSIMGQVMLLQVLAKELEPTNRDIAEAMEDALERIETWLESLAQPQAPHDPIR